MFNWSQQLAEFVETKAIFPGHPEVARYRKGFPTDFPTSSGIDIDFSMFNENIICNRPANNCCPKTQ